MGGVRDRRARSVLAVALVALAGCGAPTVEGDVSPLGQDCAVVVTAVQRLTLDDASARSRARVEQAAGTLHDHLAGIANTRLHEATTRMAAALDQLAKAQATGDQGAIVIATGTVRAAAPAIADSCGTTASRLVGG